MPEPTGTARAKDDLRRRARGLCEYCRTPERFATHLFSTEHVVPVSAGGSPDDPENLALACQGCNNHKYTKIRGVDPVTGVPAPLFHPRSQRWRDHFVWSADFTEILGVTPTGRASVATLRLNREGLVNLRRALYREGAHPPHED
ncbi:MAG TPA: HNH endonuclease [Thermoanaerobaculia bacterium]|nr:HNH endonuclease [Thermoanaerobaculia bacterium]